MESKENYDYVALLGFIQDQVSNKQYSKFRGKLYDKSFMANRRKVKRQDAIEILVEDGLLVGKILKNEHYFNF